MQRRPYREVLDIIRKGTVDTLTEHDLPTPCLVVDLDQFERNLTTMSTFTRERGIHLRPHAKTHKSAAIARRQIEEGAIGICAATIAEAEMLAANGVSGLLLTGEMIGYPKVQRLMELAAAAPDLMAVADDDRNVDELQEAAAASGITLNLLVDLDVGTNRTGAQPGEPALSIAQRIERSGNLRLRGICAYAGHAAHIRGFEARKAHSNECWSKALDTRDLFLRHGLPVDIVTGASTGTYSIDSGINGVTELQSGSYVFMDVDYRRIGGPDGPVYEDFSPALFLLATVVHRSGSKAVIDAGFKSMATDKPFGPEVHGAGKVVHEFAGDEHSRLYVDQADREIRLGDRLRLIVPHCDPTVNLYDRFYGIREGRLERVWSIMDRSAANPFF